MAAGDPEVQYTDTYGFSSSCTSGKCIATIISGPPPRNPTVPQPVQFTWDGSSWTQVSDSQWDCMMPDGTIQWDPARGEVRYTPRSDGSLWGTMHTEIVSGACQGTVDMHMTAERVRGQMTSPAGNGTSGKGPLVMACGLSYNAFRMRWQSENPTDSRRRGPSLDTLRTWDV